jgi:uncharacterized membrane protein YGL010W
MLGTKTPEQWVAEYARSHQHPLNQLCHTIGIPLIAIFVRGLWPWALGLFVAGWVLQFVGHGIEGKPPEFFRDWRFLFVGLRWWIAKVGGR